MLLGSTKDEGLRMVGDFLNSPETVEKVLSENETTLPFLALFREPDEGDDATREFAQSAINFFFQGY